jgi:hypothetical protein|nr:MAG TPA: Terminase small subunit [Caudoviricetes sp.]
MCRLFYVIIAIELRIERAAFLFGEIIMATRKMMRRNRRSSKQANRKNSKQQLRGIVKDKQKKPPVKLSKQPEQPEPGQPTKYKPEYCQQLIDYFSIEPLEIIREQEIVGTEGGKYVSRRLPQRFPWFEGFARKIGVHRNTLKNWCAEHPEFAEAYETAKDLQREFIVDVALSGAAPPSFAIFTMKNVCGWRDERDLKLKKAKEEGDIDDDELKAAIFE